MIGKTGSVTWLPDQGIYRLNKIIVHRLLFIHINHQHLHLVEMDGGAVEDIGKVLSRFLQVPSGRVFPGCPVWEEPIIRFLLHVQFGDRNGTFAGEPPGAPVVIVLQRIIYVPGRDGKPVIMLCVFAVLAVIVAAILDDDGFQR